MPQVNIIGKGKKKLACSKLLFVSYECAFNIVVTSVLCVIVNSCFTHQLHLHAKVFTLAQCCVKKSCGKFKSQCNIFMKVLHWIFGNYWLQKIRHCTSHFSLVYVVF